MAGSIDDGRQKGLIVVAVLMTTLGAVSVVLRVISRFMIMRRLGSDDWMMLLGLLFTGAYLFEIGYGMRFGMGLHTADIDVQDMVPILKLIFAIEFTYNSVVTAIKISILCFYLRLATFGGKLRQLTLATIIVLVLFYIATQFVTAFQCIPTRKVWDLTGQVKGTCINTEVYFYFAAAFNIIADIWVLLLPIKTLLGIKRPMRDKIVLIIIFGMGSLSCISSIIRLYTIKVFTDSEDPFYDGVPINVWSMIEANIAIICASVPAMKPLFTGAARERSKASLNNNSSHNAFGSRYGHQMIPLGDGKSYQNYSARAVAVENDDTGSEDRIMPPQGRIEMNVEFSVVQEPYEQKVTPVSQKASGVA